MTNATKTIQKAQLEIQKVLRRYRLNWEDVTTDLDEEIFKQIEPKYRRVRKQVVKKLYPKFYAKYIDGKKKSST